MAPRSRDVTYKIIQVIQAIVLCALNDYTAFRYHRGIFAFLGAVWIAIVGYRVEQLRKLLRKG